MNNPLRDVVKAAFKDSKAGHCGIANAVRAFARIPSQARLDQLAALQEATELQTLTDNLLTDNYSTEKDDTDDVL